MIKKEISRKKRHKRIRKNVIGTKDRPRLSIHRSNKNIYVQLVDDIEGATVFSFSTRDKKFGKYGGNINASKELGKVFGEEMKAKGITKIVFDRGGYLYHGRIKALAESLRENGVTF